MIGKVFGRSIGYQTRLVRVSFRLFIDRGGAQIWTSTWTISIKEFSKILDDHSDMGIGNVSNRSARPLVTKQLGQ